MEEDYPHGETTWKSYEEGGLSETTWKETKRDSAFQLSPPDIRGKPSWMFQPHLPSGYSHARDPKSAQQKNQIAEPQSICYIKGTNIRVVVLGTKC